MLGPRCPVLIEPNADWASSARLGAGTFCRAGSPSEEPPKLGTLSGCQMFKSGCWQDCARLAVDVPRTKDEGHGGARFCRQAPMWFWNESSTGGDSNVRVGYFQ